MSVGMTGDNYTSDRFRNLQSAVKAAGAVVVRGPLADNEMLCFFQLFYFVLNRPLHFIFTYFHIVMQLWPP